MNSLRHLKCDHHEDWFNLFVRYFEVFLEGSKDPDTKFKDFRNHVIHVSENYWGGAVKQAQKWYELTVEDLKKQDWRAAVYSAGVLSHYYMDPLMPLHTGQTEEEGVIHRACEWSINKSFDQLIKKLESTTGYPAVNIPTGGGWMQATIHQGAELAHSHYQEFIDHYNFDVGKNNPPAGLDDHLKTVTAKLLGVASVGFAKILERAIAESGAVPAQKSSTAFAWFYKLTTPVSWAFKGITQFANISRIKKIATEYKKTGKVVQALPKDEKTVRQQHATEVLIVDITELDKKPISPVGSKHVPPSNDGARKKQKSRRKALREKSQTQTKNQKTQFRLDLQDPIVDAPSIGPKTAARFEDIGIKTVGEFLSANPDEVAQQLNTRHIEPKVIQTWQTQSKMACQIPGIAGHDAQIMVACGFESPEEVANSEPQMILSLVDEFTKTREAKFIIRDGNPPDLKEVEDWIQWSKHSRNLKAG